MTKPALTLPPRRELVQTKKDKLRNDLIILLEQNELSWKMCDVLSVGDQLMVGEDFSRKVSNLSFSGFGSFGSIVP